MELSDAIYYRRSIRKYSNESIQADIIKEIKLEPSAVNVQPWRFIFDGKTVHLHSAKPTSFLTKRMLGEINRLDAGIALRHVVIIVKHVSKTIRLTRIGLPERKGLNYITSMEEI